MGGSWSAPGWAGVFASSAARRHRHFRPQVCRLEDRLVPATIVVDATHTLQAGLLAASPAGGDVIQIAPTAVIGNLSQSGGTLVNASSVGDTSITVSKFISSAEVIDLGSEPGILVDAVAEVQGNFVLTLHAPLQSAHAVGEAVNPEPNFFGIGKPVTLQGDPANAPFAFPNGFALKLYQATNNQPVTLQNLALTTGSGAVITGTNLQSGSGTGTAGDLILNNDILNLTTTGTAVFPDVGGALTVNNCQIQAEGANTAGIGVRTTGDLTISNTIIDLPQGGSADISAVHGQLLVSGCDFNLGDTGYGERSIVAGSMTVLNTSITIHATQSGSVGINLGPILGFTSSVFISGVTVTSIGPAGGVPGGVGFLVNGKNVTVVNSTVRMTNQGGSAIIAGLFPGGTETISNNVLTTGGMGTGLFLQGGASLIAAVQGNDFRGNLLGVSDSGDGTSGGTVDLGGGSLGSAGGNDFRGYPAGGQGGSFAISLSSTSATSSIDARLNVWGLDASGKVIDPHTVIQDGTFNTGNVGSGSINVGVAQLSADEAFVDTVYRTFLGRAANAVTEIPFWANLVPKIGTAGVINAIVQDSHHEAYQHLVDGFYQEFLNRSADPPGELSWIHALAAGASGEQVMSGFLTSPEFATRNPYLTLTNNTGAGYVQALYGELFSRSLGAGNLTQAEVNAGADLVALKGRPALTADVLSGSAFATADGSSFRQAAVRSYYGDPSLVPLPLLPFLPNLLRRANPPAASEIAFWANSNLGVLPIEIDLAGSPESYRDG